MPKISRHRQTIARHEPTGLYERIIISDPSKFKDVAKRRRLPKFSKKAIIYPPFDPELARQGSKDIQELALLARLTSELRLLDRISEPAPPLIKRIGPPLNTSLVTPPEYKSLPATLRFRRTKILFRIKEYNELFHATVGRLDPLFEKVDLGVGISQEVREQMMKMGKDLDSLYQDLEEKGHKLTNKQWRLLKRDLKRIGHVSFEHLSTRLEEICNKLLELELNFDYGV